MRIYASTEAHHSTHKAAALLESGAATYAASRLTSASGWTLTISSGRSRKTMAGADPFCVVATAGSVTTGAVDSSPTSQR